MNATNDDTPLAGRWFAMAALLVAGFMNLIDVTIVNVAIPSLQDAFGATDSQIEWVVAIYILTFALLLLPMGRLGDRVGRRRMFIAGVCVFTFGSALCGLAPSIYTLVAARVVQGI
ncbi:MAG: MFS transporter, partial [Alphaproteobacteria bacterium]|nr:MFS transporter [Alphaproteobacteria bacterium]